MKIQLLTIFAVAVLLLSGCYSIVGDNPQADAQAYTYTAYDSTGAAIVQGTLRIDFREVEDEGCSRHCNRYLLEGTWDLEQIGDADRIGQQVGEGELRGSVREDGRAYVNLNPNIEDDNVTLRGMFESEGLDRLEGEWTYGGWGLYNRGRFEVSRGTP